MNDETPETNSAEVEAEEILKEAFVKFDGNGDDCPLGDECPVHFRNDEEEIVEEEKYGRLITYVGEYVVTTGDNPDSMSPAVLVGALLTGRFDLLPEMYETVVIHVGDKALADLRALGDTERAGAIRHVIKFDEWENFKTTHESTVMAVREGLIDLSKPAFPKEG